LVIWQFPLLGAVNPVSGANGVPNRKPKPVAVMGVDVEQALYTESVVPVPKVAYPVQFKLPVLSVVVVVLVLVVLVDVVVGGPTQEAKGALPWHVNPGQQQLSVGDSGTQKEPSPMQHRPLLQGSP
jgi:hypothetical protein